MRRSSSRRFVLRRFAPAACGVILASLVGVVGYQRASARHTESEQGRIAAFEAACDALDSIEFVPLAERGVVADRLGRSISRAIARDGSIHAEAISKECVDFLVSRYAETPSGYAAWRRSAAYEPIDLDVLKSKWFLAEAYKAYTSEDLPGEISWDDLHLSMIGIQRSYERGRLSIRAVAGSDETVVASFGTISRRDNRFPAVGGLPGALLDNGGSISTAAPWWQPSIDVDSMIESDAGAEVCVVGLVAEFGDGKRRPISLSFVREPAGSRWWLVSPLSVGVCEHGKVEGIRIEY